jgi:hypothetical protein
VTEQEQAANAEAMLTGRVCANCQWRFPAQMDTQNIKGVGRKALLCGLVVGTLPRALHQEVTPTDSCEHYQRWQPALARRSAGSAPR